MGWRGSAGLRAYVDVNESMHIMRLLGVDLTEFGKVLEFYAKIFVYNCIFFLAIEINKYQKAREEALKLEQISQNDQEEIPSKTDDDVDMVMNPCPASIKNSTRTANIEVHLKDEGVGDE